MKILLVVKDMEHSNGGVCTHLLMLIKEYKKQGHFVLLAYDGSDYEDEIKQLGIETVTNIPLKKTGTSLLAFIKTYKRLVKVCKDMQIDIIHLHTQSCIPIAHAIQKRLGTPFVWTNHVDDIPQVKVLKLFHRLFKFPIISVSEELKRDLEKRLAIEEKYVTVIPNGINLELYTPLNDFEKNNAKEKYKIVDTEYNVGILSRVVYNKGQDILVRAIDKFQQNNPNISVHLLIAGSIQNEQWYKSEVLEYAIQNNIKLSYLGFQNPRDIFGVIDVFVLPSRKEGFGIVCIEAMAMKCPVIRSKSPGWSEMQEFANVIEIEDVIGLSKALECAYNHEDIETNKQKAYEEVLKRYTSEAMSNSTLYYYNEIIRNKTME